MICLLLRRNQLDYRFCFARDSPCVTACPRATSNELKDHMEYFSTTSNAARRAVDCVIIGLYERGKLSAAATDIDAASKGAIKRLAKSDDLSG